MRAVIDRPPCPRENNVQIAATRYDDPCRAGPWSRRYAAMIACGDVDLRCRSTGGSEPPPYSIVISASFLS